MKLSAKIKSKLPRAGINRMGAHVGCLGFHAGIIFPPRRWGYRILDGGVDWRYRWSVQLGPIVLWRYCWIALLMAACRDAGAAPRNMPAGEGVDS